MPSAPKTARKPTTPGATHSPVPPTSRSTARRPSPPTAGGEHVVFTAELWRWSGTSGSWHFFTLPEEAAAWIKFLSGKGRRGFGSVRVTATIGSTTWATSVFPDAKSGSYLLPVKADVRTAERLAAGSSAKVRLDFAAPEPLHMPRSSSKRFPKP